ncbi:12096_t:CDS:2, partial [Cetraspora pellucida]
GTLRRAVKNRLPKHTGPKTVLSKHEEEQLVGYCKNMQKLEFGLTRSGPDRAWWNHFLKDHLDLSFQNMDKTDFVISTKDQKVLMTKGARQVHKVSHRNVHEYISVAPTISVAGDYIPLLIIYKGVCMIPGLLAKSPDGAVMGFTDIGYMQESLFQMYIEHFIKSILPICLILLILDGHKSHVNYTSVRFCHENGILLYALPSYTTHILQASKLPFAKLKKEYNKGCDKLHNTKGEVVTKYTFAKILGPAFATIYTSKAIINAFRDTGTWLLNSNAISPERLVPLLPTEKEPSSSKIVPSSSQPTRKYFTRTGVAKERSYKLINEELETFKNPGTCPLKIALKYSTSQLSSQTNKQETCELEAAEEAAKSKAKNIKRKKEIAAQKKLNFSKLSYMMSQHPLQSEDDSQCHIV